MALDIFKKKKSSKEEDLKKRRSFLILEEAISQRSKIHIQFEDNITSLKNITGQIIGIVNDNLQIELQGISRLTDTFINNKISGFFRLTDRENRNKEIFYSFLSTITGIKNTSLAILVSVSFPENIEGTQRRKSIRLKPDLNKFSLLALWKYDSSDGFDISKPTITHSNFKNLTTFLDNISAGGFRIILKHSIVTEQTLLFSKGNRFIIYFKFIDEFPGLRTDFWLVGKINNIYTDVMNHDMTAGFEFIANGIKQLDSGKITWNKVDDNVIEDLAQRIYHWHLSLYRDKGIV